MKNKNEQDSTSEYGDISRKEQYLNQNEKDATRDGLIKRKSIERPTPQQMEDLKKKYSK